MNPNNIHAARSILATCRHLISGYEIDLLEWISNAGEEYLPLTRDEEQMFCSLVVEFAAQISLAAEP